MQWDSWDSYTLTISELLTVRRKDMIIAQGWPLWAVTTDGVPRVEPVIAWQIDDETGHPTPITTDGPFDTELVGSYIDTEAQAVKMREQFEADVRETIRQRSGGAEF